MIELNSNPPSTDEVKLFLGLLNIVGDAEGSRKRVAELHAAATASTAAARFAMAEQERLGKIRTEHDEYLRTTRRELDLEIKTKRTEHDRDCQKLLAELQRKMAETDRLFAQASEDAQAAATLRADIASRLQKINQLAAV